MVVKTHTENSGTRQVEIVGLESTIVRFCGDSGDGMQLAGTQLTNTSAIFGNDVSTLPDFPAEIRAPVGTLAGVSGFQLAFGSKKLRTPGDEVDVLVAMNPAALKTNIGDLDSDGTLIVNEDAFTDGNLSKAGYTSNPLENGELDKYRVFRIPIEKLNAEACKDTGLTGRAIGRCKNFFALGVIYWLYGRPMEPTLDWINSKFGSKPVVAEANTKTLKAGYYYGETTEMFTVKYTVAPAKIEAGRYRKLTGNEAMALGLITAAKLAKKPLFYGTYPITPASDILHELAHHKSYDVRTFQAEDEIAAMASVVGAAFAGAFAATGSSGPGIALKGEAIGLGIMAELPMVIINVQRGGPSTGLPTKTEQADLAQALWGRNGESPMCILAPRSPGDCFDIAIEAFRLAVEFMTPVMVLSDGYLANGAEPWKIPDVTSLPKITVTHPSEGSDFQPYRRDKKLARPWAIPGTAGLQHRIGGLEKQDITGDVCYDPKNHEHMIRTRRQKIDNIADAIAPLEVFGEDSGELLLLGWGGTYGSITAAVENAQAEGLSVSSAHLRHLDPMPKNTGDVLRRFKKILIPELNMGQLLPIIRGRYLVDAIGFNKIQGKPFMISEIEDKIKEMLGN